MVADSDDPEEFRAAVRSRVAVARSGLAAAAAAFDSRALSHAWDELEDALAQARRHGITPPARPGKGA
jgi:hypothetical protein